MLPATVDLPPEQILATLDRARVALATVRSLPEAKQIHDQAAALRHYTKKRAYALSVQNDAAEVTLRAFRRIGELLAAQVRAGNPQLSRERTIGLREVGISRNESSQSQQIAALPARPEAFRFHGDRVRAYRYGRESVQTGLCGVLAIGETGGFIGRGHGRTGNDTAGRIADSSGNLRSRRLRNQQRSTPQVRPAEIKRFLFFHTP